MARTDIGLKQAGDLQLGKTPDTALPVTGVSAVLCTAEPTDVALFELLTANRVNVVSLNAFFDFNVPNSRHENNSEIVFTDSEANLNTVTFIAYIDTGDGDKVLMYGPLNGNDQTPSVGTITAAIGALSTDVENSP